MIKKKIGWQKYEDVLENQLSHPLLKLVIDSLHSQTQQPKDTDEPEHNYSDKDEPEEEGEFVSIVAMPDELAQDAALVSNFDCWVGHTNFDITPSILNELNETDGVEILKLCSRYRFFIGVGRMFDFKNVRKNLEENILKGRS